MFLFFAYWRGGEDSSQQGWFRAKDWVDKIETDGFGGSMS